jgi:AIPR protein
MEIKELINYRINLLENAKNEDEVLSESLFIECVLPSILDAKLIDSEEYTDSYFTTEIDKSNLKINGYLVNNSGERLQIIIVNNDSLLSNYENLEISQKEYYDAMFKSATNFVSKAIKGYLNEIQDVGNINALIHQMSSYSGIEKFDVIEIFLISATATVINTGSIAQAKRMVFKDESLKLKQTGRSNDAKEKEILIQKKLIDLNLLYSIEISQGNRDALKIDFQEQFNFKLEAIKAADEINFESYLCVLPAEILADLYRVHSSRLLEKNVRSFLSFKGANAGMRKTLNKEPEKFIAYNNGLTITAGNKEVEIINDKIFIKSLSDFQIVNGGQTTASIYFSKKDGVDISKVKIMAKINVAKEVSDDELNELISNISEFSNSQTKVTTVDLRSRNPQLNIIKSLSESIITPSGRKWFFEKSKGEFNTKLKIAGQSSKNRIEKEYPKEFRFTKEQLGKYFCAWNNEPYKVKKGGEAVFRTFLEEIGDAKSNIDRNFYELLISKIILFKALEKIYGSGNNAIGQMRSAVIPYTISIIYSVTEADKKNTNNFDLSKLWISESLDVDLELFFKKLMILINDLVKKYSKSDDIGEYSKKKELWDDIVNSKEVKLFLELDESISILNKYSISKKELEKRHKANKKNKEVDFKIHNANILIHSRTINFYNQLNIQLIDYLSEYEKNKISNIISSINMKNMLGADIIDFEEKLLRKIRESNSGIFNSIHVETNFQLIQASELISKIYNKVISKNLDLLSEFHKIELIGNSKGTKYCSVYSEIGKGLKELELPTMKQMYNAAYYFEK